MDRVFPLARKILIGEDITARAVSDTINKIFEINESDRIKEDIYKEYKTPPIELFINSVGGVIYDGLALFDVIKNSKTPVHTIAIGSTMSMGLWIFMAGKERLVGKNATLMWHDVGVFSHGKTEEVKQDLEESKRLQKKAIDAICCETLVEEDTLQDYIIRKAEWYITPKQAIELQIATGYYK